jgi:transposase
VPKPFPKEFREDVVRVARSRDSETTLEQIAKDFGVHQTTLNGWMRRAEIEDGMRPGVTAEQNSELRELRRRNRLLEQENEVLRRAAAYLSQANLPSK